MIEKLIHEALTLNLKSEIQVIEYVTSQILQAGGIQANCLTEEKVVITEFSVKVSSLSKTLSHLPRGNYALLSFNDDKGRTFWKALISDGSGDEKQPEQYALYVQKPTFKMILMNMLGAEIKRKLPIVAKLYNTLSNIKIIDENKLHEGDKVKNVSVPGYKSFSTVIINKITEAGNVELSGFYRGSNKIHNVKVPAASMQIRH